MNEPHSCPFSKNAMFGSGRWSLFTVFVPMQQNCKEMVWHARLRVLTREPLRAFSG